MLRVTIELVPHGNETAVRKIGMLEIANDGTGTEQRGSYVCVLKKTPPWSGALKAKWKDGKFQGEPEDEEIISGFIEGFDRIKRGPYDILYRALRACGIGMRNP